MKIALVLAVVLIGVWLFRANRRSDRQRTRPTDKPQAMALDMVRCRQCDMHLPKSDAIAGKQGIYCSPEHRQRAES
jgi:uncharacterized protein